MLCSTTYNIILVTARWKVLNPFASDCKAKT